MRAWLLLLLLVPGCDGDSTPCHDKPALHCTPGFTLYCVDGEWDCSGRTPDFAMPPVCSLDTINTDCAASCGTPDGGLGTTGTPNWPCRPDPQCIGGHYQFDCN